ncbi:hypothetical protein EIP86_002396 [Pleurotus ostreatoroseus]|nr:hypothetical protein EIP86_002396 [Pleurotus ostreatoroseus]
MNEMQTAQIQFNGSAIYVFGITWQSTNRGSEISFLIDGQVSGSYTNLDPPNDNTYTYNVCLWANDSIGPGLHTFTLQNGQAGGIKSLILLDYIIYSQERDEVVPMPSSISSSPGTFSTAATSVPPPGPSLTSTSSSALTSSSGSSTANAATTTSSLRVATGTSNSVPASVSSGTITTSAFSDISSIVGSSNSTFQQPSTSLFQQNEPPASPSDALPVSSTPVVVSKAANHTRTVVLASVLPSVAAVAIFILWLLRRRHTSIRRNERHAPPSQDELHTEDTRPVLGATSVLRTPTILTSSKGRNLYSTLEVSTARSSELPSQQESSESSVEITDSSDAGALSELGFPRRDIPRTPGGGFDPPPAYHTLSSSE